MVDAKTEVETSHPPEPSERTTLFHYDSMRFLVRAVAKNWLEKHEKGRSLREITEIIDDPNEKPERQAEAADIRYIKLTVLPRLLVQNEEEYPRDKTYPLHDLTDSQLSWLIINAPEEVLAPSIIHIKKEAEKRKIQPNLDDALSTEVPRELMDNLTYQKPERRSMMK